MATRARAVGATGAAGTVAVGTRTSTGHFECSFRVFELIDFESCERM